MKWSILTVTAVASVLLVGALLSPILGAPLLEDDFLQQNAATAWLEGEDALPGGGLRGADRSTGPNLYCFVRGDPDRTEAEVASGRLPWWTFPGLELCFWRPLASLSLTMDAWLWPKSSLAMRIHGLLWFAALVFSFAYLVGRAVAPSAAVLSVLVFALDDTRFAIAWWPANRYATIAAVFGILGLIAHTRLRRGRPLLAPIASAALLVVALLAGESALGFLGYLLAWEIVAARDGIGRRIWGASVPSLMAMCWLVAYRIRGFGASGSDSYLDLATPAGTALATFILRTGRLIGAQIAGVAAEFGESVPTFDPFQQAFAAAALASLVVGVRLAFPGLPATERTSVLWFGLGSLLALPVAATSASDDRLLLVPSIGASVVIAVVLREAWRVRSGKSAREAGLLAIGLPLAIVTGLGGAIRWVGNVSGTARAVALREGIARDLAPWLTDEREPRVLVLTAPMSAIWLFADEQITWNGSPALSKALPVSPLAADHRISRTGERTLELESLGRPMSEAFGWRLMRSHAHPLRSGERIVNGPFTITVLDGDPAGVRRIQLESERDLDDPALIFSIWQDGGLRRLFLPRIGASMIVRGAPALPSS
ncbi:hypothetical protein MYXO_01171 [Myxococcaceae bacterium]|nr:hypothetical protein MYXO_01171 [Myxococcaceae bacterium]